MNGSLLKRPWLWVLLAAAFLFYFRLGDRALRNPDEGRYAEIAREMVLSGDAVTPRLYGVGYLRKPVFFYWLLALSFKLFGFHEWNARMVPATFGIFGVLAAYFFSRKIFGPKEALLAALILATNVWYVSVGRYLLIDMVFSFFVTAALCLFYLATEARDRQTVFYFLFYVCVGLAFLSKGLAGATLPAISILVYLAATRQFVRVIREMHPVRGTLIFLAITLPWLTQISAREPHFLKFFFWHEHWNRFVSPHFEHQSPWYTYFILMPVVMLPWVLFFKPLKTADRRAIFLWTGALTPVLFYSLSRTKLATYILPSIPFFAMLVGREWARLKKQAALFFLLAGFSAAVCLGAPILMERINSKYTTKHFAAALKPLLRKGDLVVIYDDPGAFYDFEFYLDFPVRLSGPRGFSGEFGVGGMGEAGGVRFFSLEELQRMTAAREKFYWLMRRSDFSGLDEATRRGLLVLKEDERKVLAASGPAGGASPP
ncbi:MAG: glycosyltransferase family 39 protein [Candidatus Omnitrophica bacterium]|nr:glycosyltransferase family 39 protein [Candidatus Omnitrophota bacterium]